MNRPVTGRRPRHLSPLQAHCTLKSRCWKRDWSASGSYSATIAVRVTGTPPEWPESVPPGASFMEVLVERGLGQDDGVDLVIYLDQLMDDDIKALWQRLMAADTGTGESPRVWETQDREPWPRPDW